MKVQQLTKEDFLRKKIRIQNVIILLLFIGLLLSIYMIYEFTNPSKGRKFQDPLDEPTAISNIRQLRKWPRTTSGSSHGVWYDPDTIRKYLDVTYPAIKNNLRKNGKPPAGYEWKVGFYWMMSADSSDNNKTKRGFCVMPILVNEKNRKGKDVIDYFDDPSNIYNHLPEQTTLDEKGKGNAYDNGQLWP